ncbi:MAG: DUF3108 domain-containing protein [Desulfobulbus sp.]|jgi:hypothetical protein
MHTVHHWFFRLLLALTLLAALSAGATAKELASSEVRADTLRAIFSGGERLHYAVSWSGGVKIGDVYLAILPQEQPDTHLIQARVRDYGPLTVFYPVNDTFRCVVGGEMKLPTRYEVEQKEGYGREISRLTLYNQDTHLVRYRKNKEAFQEFQLDGMVYNEFASFIITRALNFNRNNEIVVPTFADKKRHEVGVTMVERERRPSVFGDVRTLKVQPRMQFKGLYEKSGETVLWLTDDQCRVPVEIQSRIVIGSLVAKLVEYENPACAELTDLARRKNLPAPGTAPPVSGGKQVSAAVSRP